MNKKSKKIISVLTLISLFNLLLTNVFASEINTSIKEESITISRRYLDDIPKIGEYEYLDKYKINVSKYENNGGAFGTYTLDQAFDNDWNTFWESSDPNSTGLKNYITATFDNTYDVSRILYATKNHGTIAAGYPEKLKIMSSETDSGDNFVEVDTYTSEKTNNKVIFEFSKPVKAKRIKFVFEDVYDSWASASEIMFLKEDSLLNEVENMFSNEEYSELKEEYMNDEIVEGLEKQVKNHPLSDYLLSKIDIAKKIVTGEIDKENSPVNSTDFPVHVIQKTGPDSEKRVLLFMAEGYTADEQDKFINDVNEKVEEVLDIEPFRRYINEFNIYAMKVVSNETGVSNMLESEKKDTYFKMYCNGRKVVFVEDGVEKARRLIKQFKNNYLDEGANVVNTNILVNSKLYGGLNYGGIAIATLHNQMLLAHELSHGLDLDDEYFESSISTQESSNRTTEGDPNKIKWKEFLGFRGVDIVKLGTSSNGTDVYKPSSRCIMHSVSVHSFCEVCKLQIATNINESIKNKKEFYVADPITTIKLQSSGYESGMEITDSNITHANGHKLEFRTVVKNFTSEDKNLELQFTITDKDGQVKHKVSQDFVVKADELKSLQVVTNELTNLVAGNKISGKVIEKSENVELANHDTANRKFGTVKIKYKLATAKNETDIDMDLIGEQITKVEANTKYTLTPPTLKDYIYLRNNVNDSTVEIKAGEQREIIYYYAKKRGKVILELLDENGNKVRDKERYIKYNETFIPSKSDFPEKEGYELKLPNSVTYEGADYQTITYQYVKKEEIVKEPVINGIKNIEIKAGQVDEFNKTGKLEGITATDYKGNSLQITVTGKVEKPKAGTNEEYELIYEVTDSYGNTTKETRVITVTNQLPVINGLEKLVIKEGQHIDLLLGVTASDKEDGNITNILVDGSVDINTVGLYEVIYKVTDSDGNTTTVVREIVVERNTEVMPPSDGSNGLLPPIISDAINNNLLNLTYGSGTIDEPVELEFNNISDDKVDSLLSDLKGLNIKINSLEEKDGYTFVKFSILEKLNYKTFKMDNIKAINGEVHIVLKAKNEYQSIANKLKEFAGNTGDTGNNNNTGNGGNTGDIGNNNNTGNGGNTEDTGNNNNTGNGGNTEDTGNNNNTGNDGNAGDTSNNNDTGNGGGSSSDTDKKNESLTSKPTNNEAKSPQTGDRNEIFILFIVAVVAAVGGTILKVFISNYKK